MAISSEANYTVELRKIGNVFNFNYDFYDDQFKCDFEKKFIDYYYFYEIGFETIARFQKHLQAKLNVRMPYYTQLYETELKAEGLNFLLNKDLVETTTRSLNKEGNTTGTNNSQSTNKNTTNVHTTEDQEQSNISDGVSNALLQDGYLTGVNRSIGDQGTHTEGEGTTAEQLRQDITGKETETIELVSRGNIGVTSSAELLQKWRSVIINIDELIIQDCKSLFMGVY